MKYNLKSDMREDYEPIDVEFKLVPIYRPNEIPFPLDILTDTSEYNSFHEELGTKLYGRQLAGHIKRLATSLDICNTTATKAGSIHPDQLRGSMSPMLYCQASIRKGGLNLREMILDSVAQMNETLTRAEQLEKITLPPLWATTITTLIKAGLFAAPPLKQGEKTYPASMWQLPEGILDALKIKDKMPPPYSKEKRETIEALEQAIQILERLHALADQMAAWICNSSNGSEIERPAVEPKQRVIDVPHAV